MTYGNIYVAQVNSGANQAHTLKAMIDAESYNGPSVMIAYSPCIAHGIKGGMSQSQEQGKFATEVGYWPLYTHDPRLVEKGKNPIKITGKEPKWDEYNNFLMTEARYVALTKTHPERAKELFEHNRKDAQRRYNYLKGLANIDYSGS